MNNDLFTEDIEPEVVSPILRERQSELVRIIESLQVISSSEPWQVLKSLVFDKVVEQLEKRLKLETAKKPIDTDEIHRLNGQLIWAKRYADFNKLIDVYRLELENIRSKLNASH